MYISFGEMSVKTESTLLVVHAASFFKGNETGLVPARNFPVRGKFSEMVLETLPLIVITSQGNLQKRRQQTEGVGEKCCLGSQLVSSSREWEKGEERQRDPECTASSWLLFKIGPFQGSQPSEPTSDIFRTFFFSEYRGLWLLYHNYYVYGVFPLCWLYFSEASLSWFC